MNNVLLPRSVLPLCLTEARALSYPLYLVGGIVRDAVVLAQSSTAPLHDFDFDLVCEGNAIRLAQQVARHVEGAELRVHEAFMTAKLMLPGGAHIDFVTSRTERYDTPGALPCVEQAPLEKDLFRRDFTVNCMAVRLEDFLSDTLPPIIDPFEGKKALLDDRQLIILHPRSFVDDPTRLFRAARYATRFDLTFDSVTERAFDEAVNNNVLSTISNTRILNELKRVCEEPHPRAALLFLHAKGLLSKIELFSPSSLQSLRELESTLAPETFFAWLYQRSDPTKRQGVFSSYGFGKKFFKVAQ